MSDEGLIARIARQEPNALGDLYDRYARLVFSLAYHILNDHSQAEEVTQEVFLSVWQNVQSFDVSKAKFTTWLSQIARNKAIDQLRKRNVRPDWQSLGWEDAFFNQADASQAVETKILTNEQSEIIIQALKKLPAEQRQVIAMAYFYGLSQSQIADELVEPLGTVKTRIRLGMQKLRAMVSDFP
jgi:RNA polymerase sigma-70 factor (ECF subfamily)